MHDEKTIARFMSKVATPGNSVACWFWKGALNYGYGHFSIGYEGHRAHKISWEIHHRQPWPHGLIARHGCDNKNCVNPEHVTPGTQKENVADCIGRNRYVFRPRATVCKRGHDLTKENSRYLRKNGNSSGCKQCVIIRTNEYRRNKQERTAR